MKDMIRSSPLHKKERLWLKGEALLTKLEILKSPMIMLFRIPSHMKTKFPTLSTTLYFAEIPQF